MIDGIAMIVLVVGAAVISIPIPTKKIEMNKVDCCLVASMNMTLRVLM